MFWSELVDLLRAMILSVAQVCNGSVGVAVILVSFAIRLALLPLTLRLARRARDHQRRLRELKPALERMQRRYANDPAAMWRETQAFYRRRNVKQLDPAGFFGALAQAPVFMSLYAALRRGLGHIRFLWIADTSISNAVLTLVVATVTGLVLLINPAPESARTVQLITVVLMAGLTVWFLSSTAALFALSTGAGSLVGILQAVMLRRDDLSRKRQLSKP
jgi:YidC/Oxa1 family membrane protein insertase